MVCFTSSSVLIYYRLFIIYINTKDLYNLSVYIIKTAKTNEKYSSSRLSHGEKSLSWTFFIIVFINEINTNTYETVMPCTLQSDLFQVQIKQ